MDFVESLGLQSSLLFPWRIKTSPRDLLTAFKCVVVAYLDPGETCLTEVSGWVKRQIQVIQKPRLGWPSQNHEEQLEIRLTQLG